VAGVSGAGGQGTINAGSSLRCRLMTAIADRARRLAPVRTATSRPPRERFGDAVSPHRSAVRAFIPPGPGPETLPPALRKNTSSAHSAPAQDITNEIDIGWPKPSSFGAYPAAQDKARRRLPERIVAEDDQLHIAWHGSLVRL